MNKAYFYQDDPKNHQQRTLAAVVPFRSL